MIVFDLLKRKKYVYKIILNTRKVTLQGIIRCKVGLESVIHSNGWKLP